MQLQQVYIISSIRGVSLELKLINYDLCRLLINDLLYKSNKRCDPQTRTLFNNNRL